MSETPLSDASRQSTETHLGEQNLDLRSATGIEISRPVAGLGSRAYAYIIDWHIRVLLFLLWIFGWLGLVAGFQLEGALDSQSSMLQLFVIPSLLYTLYHPVVEVVMRGSSPGKKKAGIACVDVDGNVPTSGAILLRNVMRLIDSLPIAYTVGMVSILLTRNQVRLGDMVAGTRIVVSDEVSDEELTKLERIRDSGLEPKQAELIYDLLQRWSSLERAKRLKYGNAMLEKLGYPTHRADGNVKRKLASLIGNK